MSTDRILNFVVRVRNSLLTSAVFALLIAGIGKFIFGLSNAKSFFFVALPIVLIWCRDPLLNIVPRAGGALGAGIFWGFLAAVAAGYVFGLSDDQSLYFVFLPIAAAVAVFVWVKLPVPGTRSSDPEYERSSRE